MTDADLWTHHNETLNGIALHFVRAGTAGPETVPLILLHGWPEFWFVYHKLIPLLADGSEVAVPDLRGFGDSGKPPGAALESYRLEDHVADVLALADHLGWDRFGVVSHDIGAMVAQVLGRDHADRVAGLFFFDMPYAGIGPRWCAPDHLNEIWYQGFHQEAWAADLLATSREATRIYFRNMLAHWAHDPSAFDADLEAWVDNFLKPGNLQGGFNWYSAILPRRLPILRGEAQPVAKITVPTCVRWGASDPVLKVDFADRLADYFADLDFAPVPDAGHFVHYERPDFAAAEISRFFTDLR